MELMKFKHVLPALEVDIYDAPMEWADKDCEIPHSDATIHFGVDIETREYGIKGIYPYVSKIEISIGDEDHTFKDDEDGWSIQEESNLSAGTVVPDRVDVDCEQKIITVIFS